MEFLDKEKFSYTNTATKNLANIEKTPKCLELSFIKDLNVFKQIDGAFYSRQISKWVIPLEKQQELEEMLQKYKFSFIVQLKGEEVNEQDDSDTTDDEPQKKVQKKQAKAKVPKSAEKTA